MSTITLGITSSGASGHPVTFSIVSGPGSLSGTTLIFTGVGTVIVAANQAGNANYAAAPQVTQSIEVNPAPDFTVTTYPSALIAIGGQAPKNRGYGDAAVCLLLTGYVQLLRIARWRILHLPWPLLGVEVVRRRDGGGGR
jgi:hypothetical protein